MDQLAAPLAQLVEQFERLPGIGHKTAQRLAFHILAESAENARQFADAILAAKETLSYCGVCCNITDKEVCDICASPRRDTSLVCVVEEPRDVIALERAREYKGLYHILHGVISPMDGIGPDALKIKELLARLHDTEIKEIIMATNPNIEGEATAMYLANLLKPLGVKVSRLAYGIPVGSHLEYADEITLLRAIEGRREI